MLNTKMQTFMLKYGISNLVDLRNAIISYKDELPVEYVYRAAELLNPNKESTAAYYTDHAVCDLIHEYLPNYTDRTSITILEPSVGAGRFLPMIAEKYKNIRSVEITIVDIDEKELELAALIFETFYKGKYANITIRHWKDDYLLMTTSGAKYDLIIGNPPYDKLKSANVKLKKYRKNSDIVKTTNLFVFFLEKALKEAKCVSLVVPKSLLNAPEYVEIRKKIKSKRIASILDFGEFGFKGVKIETVNIIINTDEIAKTTVIMSQLMKETIVQKQEYITDETFPTWLLYRNQWFDEIVSKLEMNLFEVFRDRQIVNSMLLSNGKIRVLKSRNIADQKIVNIANYDTYCDNIDQLAVGQYLNKRDVVCVPNLSYSPRATFLPQNAIANGSVALLTLKDKSKIITNESISFFGTEEFSKYYRIARNFGTRSLNIDSSSVYYFGLKRECANEMVE